MLLAACAPVPAPAPPRNSPSAENPTPPPKGTPPPRLDPVPDRRVSEEPLEPRFRVLEGEAHEEVREARREVSVERAPTPALPDTEPRSSHCLGLSPEEQTLCPLETFGPAAAIEDIPRGVRLRYVGERVTVDRLRKIIGCQIAGAGLRSGPRFCPFFDTDSVITVAEQRGQVIVDIIDPQNVSVATLREQIRAALPRGRRAGDQSNEPGTGKGLPGRAKR